jgi:YD repeat-containing protein
VITPGVYTFALKCNTVREKTKSNLKKRKSDVRKGSAHNSSRRNSGRGPIPGHRGPNVGAGEDSNNGPLTSEDRDMSQFSLEYNKWGNLIGFNFQLNEDGTTLKDPDSVESGVDSRWSWNAIASPKKGYMNKLLLK